MNNDVFSLHRFIVLARKHYTDSRRWYLLGYATVFVTILGLYIFAIAYPEVSDRGAVFALSFITGSVGLFANTYKQMRLYANRQSRVSALTTPASNAEKYLLVWSSSLLLYMALFVGVWVLIDSSFSLLYDYSVGWISHWQITLQGILFLTIAHSVALWRGMLNGLPKTKSCLLIVCIVGGSMLWMTNLPAIFGADPINANSVWHLSMRTMDSLAETSVRYKFSWISQSIYDWVLYGSAYTIPLVCWVAGYFKFKERELK